MAMISPSVDAFSESLSTLKFAHRAKAVKNVAVINEDEDQKAVLHRYEVELGKLREELEAKNKNLVDKGRVIQLEEEKRKAEQDKKAAMAALELRSREFFNEREEKRKLEEQIMLMRGQLVYGGLKNLDSNQGEGMGVSGRENLERNWNRKNYEKRIEDLENERHRLEESQAQVDRYKSLLQKQRDIMIALTTRLNERDEAIGQLQEELDAYDKIHKEAERSMDFYKRRVSTLENELNRRGINLPNESGDYHRKDNKVAPSQDKDTVKLGEIETFNINYKNLSFAQEKIEELREIAEERERKIEKLEIERQELLEHDQNKGNDLASALKENAVLRKKVEEYQKNVKRLKDNKGNIFKFPRIIFLIGSDSENSNMEYVTTSVDEIVSN
jgi:hypothetical protein